MSENTNCEKLANVFNQASQQGKDGFIKMLWSNQPMDVQTQLRPLLASEVLEALEGQSE